MLRVCTSSTQADLTTLDAAQEILGAPSTDEPLLSRLISRASRWAETYINQPRPENKGDSLGVQVYLESIPAYGARTLMLSRTPIRAIQRVFDSTATSGATEYLSSEYRIEDAETGLISFVDDSLPAWTAMEYYAITDYRPPRSETRPWLIEYEAGWTLNGTTSTVGGTTSTGRTLPDDIEQAVLEKVTDLYEGRGSISSKKVGDLSITYHEDLAPTAEYLLGPYRRFV